MTTLRFEMHTYVHLLPLCSIVSFMPLRRFKDILSSLSLRGVGFYVWTTTLSIKLVGITTIPLR
ncbi:hypothetical protein EDD18DRAFT_1128271 [Armillaria luteobubalina]|uniref:Uncharacterized protein n=1 Tax=Armillaria luteobubalina TaxID=153913 RepID=A0AA39V4G5_9AGAR|nr:hypothetical protein EDD18DRAFT_1128271 [Armillaria luteobubalina]